MSIFTKGTLFKININYYLKLTLININYYLKLILIII